MPFLALFFRHFFLSVGYRIEHQAKTKRLRALKALPPLSSPYTSLVAFYHLPPSLSAYDENLFSSCRSHRARSPSAHKPKIEAVSQQNLDGSSGVYDGTLFASAKRRRHFRGFGAPFSNPDLEFSARRQKPSRGEKSEWRGSVEASSLLPDKWFSRKGEKLAIWDKMISQGEVLEARRYDFGERSSAVLANASRSKLYIQASGVRNLRSVSPHTYT